MAKQDEFYKNLIDNMYDGVYFVDCDRRITYWNKGAERITGYPSSTVIGRFCRDNLLNHVTAEGKMLCGDGCPLAACMQDGNIRDVEVYLHHADGHRVPVQVRAAPIRDKTGEITGAVETFSKAPSVRVDQMELVDLRSKVNSDELTGLRNRAYIERRLQGLVAEGGNQPPAIGILFIDIDHFKLVNDTHGHGIGDRVLKMVSETIRDNLRSTDIAGRWGGDEFIAILDDVTLLTSVKKIAEKIRVLVEQSRLDVEEQSYSVTISIGGTLLGANDTRESLVKRADELMYKMKQAGRNRVEVG
jgi:diguanylate cyclase (GGDEF)-like protein/PAS domain S-box-containing protein